ncbi:MAG: CotH kinase family protein [Opitutia bacterium]
MRSASLLLLALALLGGARADEDPPRWRIEVKGPLAADPPTDCVVRLTAETPGAPAPPLLAQIRIRGSSSQVYAKKSFALKFTSAVAPLDLPADAEWILNAAFVDGSLMRHKLSYDLFRSLTAPGQPRVAAQSRFVELDLNGRYHGAYLLMQPVTGRLLGFAAPNPADPTPGVLYKAVDHAANFGQPGHAGFDPREPNPTKGPVWGPLDELNRFVSQTPDREFLDPANGLADRLDLANAIDFHLLVLLTSNLDGITKNYYLARPAATTAAPRPRFFFVPWDYDATFGRNWDGSRVGAKEWLSNRLFDRLWTDAAMRSRFRQCWETLRAGPFRAEAIGELIDANTRALGPAIRRNEARWKQIDYAAPRELTFDEDVRQIRAWTSARLAWLDAEIARRAR